MSLLCLLNEDTLKDLWKQIDWKAAEEELRQLQRRIAVYANRRDAEATALAQQALVNSGYAKALAVRHVCTSVAKAGVDGVVWETDAQKMSAALSLDSRGYVASPMRMIVVLPKGSIKKRHIQIPTFRDRAMQTLYSYALDPVAESSGDRKSFAFRRGRSTYDVHSFILRAFSGDDPPRFLIKADVKSCYASISHDWLLKHIPMDTQVLTQFLKAGHVFKGELFPSDDFGIAIGNTISPILANMTLDGAQEAVFKGLHGRDHDIDFADGNMIRFADDILITARTQRNATRILQVLRSFLAPRGLRLSDAKTKVFNIHTGFDFLSRHYEYSDGEVRSYPSKNAVSKMEQSLRELILGHRGGQKGLIEKVNHKLTGWATYHKVTEAHEAFRHIDGAVKALLMQLCQRLNPKLPMKKILTKYFQRTPDGDHVYALVDKPDVRIHRLADVVLYYHPPLVTNMNPYLDTDYYEERTDQREIDTVAGKYKAIWARQDGKCLYCGNEILIDEWKHIVTIDPTRPHSLKNLGYVHGYCRSGQAEFYDTEEPVDTPFDLHRLLLEVFGNQEPPRDKPRVFAPLTEYFRRKTESAFTLSFREIEAITGHELCQSAKTRTNYWYTPGETRISFSWLSNGYRIRKVNLSKGTVGFYREERIGVAVEIPPVFLSGRIPPRAKAELEILFAYVKRKYAL